MVINLITMKCARCGSEKTSTPAYFRRLSSVKNEGVYYCYECTRHTKGYVWVGGGRKKSVEEIVIECVDCGERRIVYPSVLSQLKCIKETGVYRCLKCTRKLQKRGAYKFDDRIINSTTTDSKITITCNDCGKTRVVYKSYYNNLKNVRKYGVYRCSKCNLKYSRKIREFESKRLIKIKESLNTDEWREKNLLAMRKMAKDPIVRENHKKAMQQMVETYEWQLQNKERVLILSTGQGIWYGNPIINSEPKRQIYCELWEDVKPRIFAFNIDMHNGVLTCEVCENPIANGKHKFIHHHVFYEKQVCCWNNDGIYTTNLNIKTMPKDSYIIGEDPNYFAITCIKCHGTTNGGFENRKKWANFFKNKIDTKYNGKSYYTKEEMIERDFN